MESSAAVIWKPPSPAMTHTSFSGQAIFAPMAAGSAKPMVPRPPEVTSERGASCLKYWASHIWCWPYIGYYDRFIRSRPAATASRQMSLMTCAA